MSNNDVSIKVKISDDVSNNENTIETVSSVLERDNHNPEICVVEGYQQNNISGATRQDSQGSKNDGSVAQTIKHSGRISMKPKCLTKTAFLVLLSLQIGSPINAHQNSLHGI